MPRVSAHRAGRELGEERFGHVGVRLTQFLLPGRAPARLTRAKSSVQVVRLGSIPSFGGYAQAAVLSALSRDGTSLGVEDVRRFCSALGTRTSARRVHPRARAGFGRRDSSTNGIRHNRPERVRPHPQRHARDRAEDPRSLWPQSLQIAFDGEFSLTGGEHRSRESSASYGLTLVPACPANASARDAAEVISASWPVARAKASDASSFGAMEPAASSGRSASAPP